ncbi:MAG: PAS domain S-box protein [Tepidisphaeraceae bacterium]
MIVEDEPMIAEDLRRRISSFGYNVVGVAATARNAIDAVEKHKPDVVLMDITLPGEMSGVEASKVIVRYHGSAIIYVTSHVDGQTLDLTTGTESFGYLIKPIDDRELKIAMQMTVCKSHVQGRHRMLQKWMANTLQSIGDGIVATDINGAITYMNYRAEQLTQWTLLGASGANLSEVLCLETLAGDPKSDLVTAVLGEGRCRDNECRSKLRQKTGDRIFVNHSTSPIYDSEDQVTGVVVVFRDVSQSVAAETAEHRLRLIVEAASLGFWDWDLRTKQIYCSDFANRMLGQTEAKGIETIEDLVRCVHPDDRDLILQRFNKIDWQSEVYHRQEFRVVWPDGTVRWVESRGRAYFDSSGNAIRIADAVVDVTERRKNDEFRIETNAVRSRFGSLTAREKEILGMVVIGLPNKRIAMQLHISIKTVNNHRGRLMTKMLATNAADLARMSTAAGLLAEVEKTGMAPA